MTLKSLEISGFKSFTKKSLLQFTTPISSIVGPNGSGKSNVAEAFRFVLGEQSIKSLRGKRGEDLIFNGGKMLPRSNRASVKVLFDNTKRQLNIDFDEVAIERVVHRDSSNEYFLNGSQVRLKDIIELLAGASIGSSGHHIISQGEADRILSASSKERRTMIEEALGLKIYQYKKEESLRKLEKTKENGAQVESLLRELAPHLRFLKKQAEKIEKATELKRDLTIQYLAYFKVEELRIKAEKQKIEHDEAGPQKELHKIESDMKVLQEKINKEEQKGEHNHEIQKLNQELDNVRKEKDRLSRESGKIDGELTYIEREIDKQKRLTTQTTDVSVKLSLVDGLSHEINAKAEYALNSNNIEELKAALVDIKKSVKSFIEGHQTAEHAHEAVIQALDFERAKLKEAKHHIDGMIEKAQHDEKSLRQKSDDMQKAAETNKDEKIQAERDMLRLMSAKNDLHLTLTEIRMAGGAVQNDQTEFERELGEVAELIGHEILQFRHQAQDSLEKELPTRHSQQEKRRELEKMKIKLEEIGVGNMSEVMKEYKDTEERDAFLRRELIDLQASSVSLAGLIKELDDTLNREFKLGIDKINHKFSDFFALMFGGGKASLVLVKEAVRRKKSDEEELGEVELTNEEKEEQLKEGIDIHVELPHKKTKGLVMLSGGERALTSIALLFAISQVNPPPFIILDETDAALDEANSRKYGDMIETLSEYSQLILITHNRETMSRAGVIYGITMSAEGSSQLLSIAFEDALAAAK